MAFIFLPGLVYTTAGLRSPQRVLRHARLCRDRAPAQPSSLSLRTWAVSTATTGLPNFTPRLFAARCPAITRSRMMLRSSSATAPSTVNTILPAGVDVSMASERETKSMPSDANSSKARSKCEVDRANLSQRQTATTSNLPRLASAMSGLMLDVCPLPLSSHRYRSQPGASLAANRTRATPASRDQHSARLSRSAHRSSHVSCSWMSPDGSNVKSCAPAKPDAKAQRKLLQVVLLTSAGVRLLSQANRNMRDPN